MRWEYNIYKQKATGFFGGNVDEGQATNALNDFGRDGWELVSVVDTNSADGQTRWIVYVFKRPVP